MELYLHTIALEPARWTPQRRSLDLPELLPRIADCGFDRIEIYEPHLEIATGPETLLAALLANGLSAPILSSYLNLNPLKTSDAEWRSGADQLVEHVGLYGFKAVRLFPGQGMDPADNAATARFVERLRELAERLPRTELWLETHDHSLADDPTLMVRIVEELGAPNLGLLFQPTVFNDPDAIRSQFALQLPHIRHVHLQNRNHDLSFAHLAEGLVPWADLLQQLPASVDASLEFVPTGICKPDAFDLEATLNEVRSERESCSTQLMAWIIPKSKG